MSENVELPAEIQDASQPIRVSFGAGLTIGLGNYEFARVDVRIEVPCKASADALDVTYDFAQGWVSDRLEDERKKVMEDL